jgi:hypothetical protein
VLGPFSAQELRVRASEGSIKPTDGIRDSVSERFYLASTVKGLFPTQTLGAENHPPPAPQRLANHETPPSRTALTEPALGPLSRLLTSLASCVMDVMHDRVKAGIITQAQFDTLGSTLLTELGSAISHTEAGTTGRGHEGIVAARPLTPAPRRQPAASPSTSTHRRENTNASRPTAPQPPHSTAPGLLQIGAAAMAGGAWGYLLGRQGGVALGHQLPNNPAEIHYHFDTPPDTDVRQASLIAQDAPPDQTGVHDGQPTVIGVDTDNNGLIDTFYGDVNADGRADAVGFDKDADGFTEKVLLDTDNNGVFDRAYIEAPADAAGGINETTTDDGADFATEASDEVADLDDAAIADNDSPVFEATEDFSPDFEADFDGDFG